MSYETLRQAAQSQTGGPGGDTETWSGDWSQERWPDPAPDQGQTEAARPGCPRGQTGHMSRAPCHQPTLNISIFSFLIKKEKEVVSPRIERGRILTFVTDIPPAPSIGLKTENICCGVMSVLLTGGGRVVAMNWTQSTTAHLCYPLHLQILGNENWGKSVGNIPKSRDSSEWRERTLRICSNTRGLEEDQYWATF